MTSASADLPDARDWVGQAVRQLEADQRRSADTHLVRLAIPALPGVDLYFKDESTHPSGSLKHRLARSLLLYGLCNGWIGPATRLFDATSGSTAVSEAYFARLLGLPFTAVVPRGTAAAKIAAIEFEGGGVHYVDDAREAVAEAARLAAACNGHFLDQFTYAERATDWRGNNNIAESIFTQMSLERHKVPTWVVCGAGTGGTSATIGRYIRLTGAQTRLCVADPEGSVFHRHFADRSVTCLPDRCGSAIEGIGRAGVELSFIPTVIDRMIAVSDAASIGAMRALSAALGRRVGGSTGTNLAACLQLAREMADEGRSGSIVTLICDSGQRYADTYYDDAWLESRGIAWQDHAAAAAALLTPA
ncbi:PLP-dependent cysteine synthase family protein [Parablastomonas sp. CN1-191]|uniref:PLP-dependent cysteine synthase family protein n=1 Tax=Parablastomonas sp. CN1-191 TaxID=3400908 RepID=UPI003BF86261